MDVPRFRLTELPVDAAKNVLRIMSPIHLIGYSLLSKKCRNLTQSVGMRAEPIFCRISHSIQLGVEFNKTFRIYVKLYFEEKENGKHTMKTSPKTTHIGFRRNDIGARGLAVIESRMGVKEWVEHLQFLFACPEVFVMVIKMQSFRFDIQSLRETFRNLYHLELYHTGCYEFNDLILREFLPITSCLLISPSCFQNFKIPPYVFIQNIQDLKILKRNDGHLTALELDDLLRMNGRTIETENLMKTVKVFNKFLKLWIKGSNPHLEYISFRYTNWNREDPNAVMEGIEYQSMPRTLARKHRSIRFPVQGGLDFHRHDGVKATVRVGKLSAEEAVVVMFVWHDHCCVP
ncbi:hypothetical protein CAEBREN_08608 [Caenorhabditis brenneri]|uniref:F-box domain-containing protein n=1 Tax=Caenorhabditis brenneri TaxID=135651 RepID=G0P0M1_CAEBE|nr:hypothetical protein CAEBREN_08608 [Caenorhabditis brenneri]